MRLCEIVVTYQIDEDQHIWLWRGDPTSGKKQRLMKAVMETVVLPSLKQLVDLVRKKKRFQAQLLRQEVPQVAEPEEPLPIIFMLDGEATGLSAAMAASAQAVEADPQLKKLYLVKLAANCSKTQQPCDVSPLYRSMKEKLKAWKLDQKAAVMARVLPGYVAVVEDRLSPLAKGSKEVYREFFVLLPALLSAAGTLDNVMQGFVDSGLWPFDPERMLHLVTVSRQWSSESWTAALASLEPLSAIVGVKGQLTDDEIASALCEGFPRRDALAYVPETKKRTTLPLHEQALNRRRALLLTHTTLVNTVSELNAARQQVSTVKVRISKNRFCAHPCLGRRRDTPPGSRTPAQSQTWCSSSRSTHARATTSCGRSGHGGSVRGAAGRDFIRR